MGISFCRQLAMRMPCHNVLLMLCAAFIPWASGLKLQVNPSSIASQSWVKVTFSGVPQSELNRPSTEYLCKQASEP